MAPCLGNKENARGEETEQQATKKVLGVSRMEAWIIRNAKSLSQRNGNRKYKGRSDIRA